MWPFRSKKINYVTRAEKEIASEVFVGWRIGSVVTFIALLIVGGVYFAGDLAFRFPTIGLLVALFYSLKRISLNEKVIALYYEQEKEKEIQALDKNSDLSRIETLLNRVDSNDTYASRLSERLSLTSVELKNKISNLEKELSSAKSELKNEIALIKQNQENYLQSFMKFLLPSSPADLIKSKEQKLTIDYKDGYGGL